MSVKSKIRALRTSYKSVEYECSIIFPMVLLQIKMCKLKPWLCTFWIGWNHPRAKVSSVWAPSSVLGSVNSQASTTLVQESLLWTSIIKPSFSLSFCAVHTEECRAQLSLRGLMLPGSCKALRQLPLWETPAKADRAKNTMCMTWNTSFDIRSYRWIRGQTGVCSK